VRLARGVGEDHFATRRMLCFAGEGEVNLSAIRIAHLEIPIDPVKIKHGDGNRIGHRDSVAEVNQWMDVGQRLVLAVPP
jgi:hypothetical protein